jgi:glycosyltransferase involved in cell wall biosynthesis
MRIGIHSSAASPEGATYAKNLAAALLHRLHPSDRLVTFEAKCAESFADRAQPLAPFAACLASLCTDRALTRYLRSVDLSHSIGILAAPTDAGGAIIPLLADLAVQSRQMERFLAQIDGFPMVTTTSASAQTELAALTGLPYARIGVIPPGVEPIFYEPARPEDEWELQVLGMLPRQFFLHVSQGDAPADLAILLEAYATLPERIKAWLPLVIVNICAGPIPARHVAQRDIDLGNIRTLEAPPKFLLRMLYRSARLVLFPATKGGFGLTMAQALVCGATIAVTSGTALADMAGPRARLVNQADPADWQAAMEDQVDCLAQTVAPPPAHFSWDHAAAQALTIYRQALVTA